MNIAEILRKIADIADRDSDPGEPDAKIQNPARLRATAVGQEVSTPDNQDAGAEDPVMIPPLQLKTELLKRAVGVDSVFDPGEARADEVHGGEDELDMIRRHAGVPVVAISDLSDDEPLES